MAGGRSGRGDERFRVSISPPPAEMERLLKQLGDDVVDFRPAWPRMLSEVMEPGVAAAFSSKGSSLGQSWGPLSQRYAKRKAMSIHRASEMLSLTGRLRGSFRRLRNSRRAVAYGTTVPYASAVQYGNRRRFVGWSSLMKSRAQEIMQAHQSAMAERTTRAIDAKRATGK